MTQPGRLYGVRDAEFMRDDLADVWEHDIADQLPPDDPDPDTTWHIEEWTVRDNLTAVPYARWIIDHVVDTICDDGEYDDDGAGTLDAAFTDPAVVEAAEALRRAIAAHMTWHMADTLVAVHTVTIDTAGRVLCDGAPMAGWEIPE